jgi:hypothetical protein
MNGGESVLPYLLSQLRLTDFAVLGLWEYLRKLIHLIPQGDPWNQLNSSSHGADGTRGLLWWTLRNQAPDDVIIDLLQRFPEIDMELEFGFIRESIRMESIPKETISKSVGIMYRVTLPIYISGVRAIVHPLFDTIPSSSASLLLPPELVDIIGHYISSVW